jgi:hypothetical protein
MIAAGVAWLAAWEVAVASAKPAGSLHYLVPASYVAVVVVVLGFLVVVAVMYDWPARLWELRPAGDEPPLKITVGKPHYHDWNWAARVAALPVKIKNRTGGMVIWPGGCQFQMQDRADPSWRTVLSADERGQLAREVFSQEQTSHHRPMVRERITIPAHSSVDAWFVASVGRDCRGSEPRITLHLTDGNGNKYTATYEGKEPQDGQDVAPT